MNKSKIFTICDIYIVLRLIYELQFMLFGESGFFLSRLIFLLFIGISVYYTFYALARYKLPVFMKALSILLLMFTIYGIIPILDGEKFRVGPVVIPSYTYIQQIYLSLLPIFSFFVFYKKGVLTPKRIQRWILVFFVSLSLQFVQEKTKTLQMLMDAGSRMEEVTNNVGYYFLGIIPLLAFLSNKKVFQYIGLAYAMTFIIMSVKRGAIIVGAICVAWFLFNTLKTARRSQKIAVILLGVAVVILGTYFVQGMLESSAYFNTRLEATIEGDSSGRDYYYTMFWNHFTNDSNLLRFLFGNGANATIIIGGNYAHNDWLEIAINQGLLGVIIYAFFFISFFKTCKVARFYDNVYLAVSSLFIMELFKTLFSMSYADMSIYSTFCLGLCMGKISDYELNKNNIILVENR